MKRLLFILAFISLVVLAASCDKNNDVDYRQEMRNFVIGISEKAKSTNKNFAIIPQNGVELICDNSGAGLASEYISAIDGQGQEDLFFGYAHDDKATPESATDRLKSYLLKLKTSEKVVLTTDYCSSEQNIVSSREQNQNSGFVSFQATSRNLDIIPNVAIHNENADIIADLRQAKNFLYLINPENFASKDEFINAVCATNYDLIIMDLFLNDVAFTADEITELRRKANGGTRMIIAYMSIGEAEDYRYYWDQSWKRGNPSWLDKENPKWKGNYKVRYWHPEWQKIIFGNDDSYLSHIIDAGFDGVYLDIIDAFEYYE